MMQVISAIIGISETVKIIDQWLEILVTEYIKARKNKIKKENIEAIKDAIKYDDQRGLEHEDYSGKPSGIGTIRDTLPGVSGRKES